MDGNSCAHAGFKSALDPGMVKRGMFSREMDASLGFHDLIMEQGLLTRVKEGERAARVGIVMPHVRGARFELLPDLWMDDGYIFDRLLDPLMR